MAELRRLQDPAELVDKLLRGERQHFDAFLASGTAGTDALDGVLVDRIRSRWQRGWMPDDVMRLVAGSAKGEYVHLRELIRLTILREASDAGHPPELVADVWREQLDALASEGAVASSPVTRLQQLAGARAGVIIAIAWLRMPESISNLPFVCPPPGTPQGSGGRSGRPDAIPAKIVDRIRALLQKAERTTFPAEAEAFMTKAQELMAVHSIERAMLDVDSGDEPAAIRIYLDDPYASAKLSLVSAVASANRCRTVLCQQLGFAMVFGYPHDLAAVELLHTSLIVQATAAMTAHGSVRDARGRSRTRSFRSSFLVGYAARIGERLREARDHSTRAAAAAHGTDLLPVLTRRDKSVDQAVATAFPNLGRHRAPLSNDIGWHAGRAAADNADLGPRRSLSA